MSLFPSGLFLFPRDIWVLLINEYFDGIAAFNCLRVCKLFNKYVARDKIIPKYLRQRIYEDHREYIEDIENRMCKICNQILSDESALRKHINKHTKNSNKKIVFVKPPPSCNYCEVPYIRYCKEYNYPKLSKMSLYSPTHVQICPMQRIKCAVGGIQGLGRYGFVICRCEKISWYRSEIKTHACKFECRECHEITQLPLGSRYVDVMNHILVCPKKMDMVAKYGHAKWVFTHGVKTLFCYGCNEMYNECTCLCDKCGDIHANKSNGKLICDECATCEGCGVKWDDLSHDEKVWNFKQPPYCRQCFDLLNWNGGCYLLETDKEADERYKQVLIDRVAIPWLKEASEGSREK